MCDKYTQCMQQANNQTVRAIEAIETVLSDQFEYFTPSEIDQEIEDFRNEIEYTRLVRISKEISKFGGVRE